MNNLHVGLLTAELNGGNMGCNALCYSAILLLEEAARQMDFVLKYTIFGDFPKEVLSRYPNLASTQIQIVSPALTLKSKIKKILQRQTHAISGFNRSFNSCDLFFEIAGGDSFSDIYGIERPAQFAQYHARAAKNNKPLIFLPQTIGPFTRDKAQKIASKSLSYAHHIFARDPISYNKVLEFTTPDKATKTIDMACFMDYVPREKSEHKIHIGINPSGLLWHGGYRGDNQFSLKMEYKELIFQIIELLHDRKYEVALVPHDLHGPDYAVGDDYIVCKQLQHKYPFCEVAPFFYTPMEAKSYISGLSLLIGSRMHCCIAAYSSGVPIYPLSYSRKFRGLFKEELDYPHVAELTSEDAEQVIHGLQNVLAKLADIQAGMPGRLDRLLSYKRTLIDELKNVLSSALR